MTFHDKVAQTPTLTLELRSNDGGDGRRWPLEPTSSLAIGREFGNDIRIDHPEVSPRHAEVVWSRAGWVLRDLGSERGVWVNNRRRHEVALAEGTTVALGPEASAPSLVVMAGGGGLTKPVAGAPEHTIVVGRRSPVSSVTIGRGTDNDLVVDDLLVSRRHLRATRCGYGFVLEDLGSRTGSFVNGTRITSGRLDPLDRLTIGHLEFSVDEGQLVMVPQRTQVSLEVRDLDVTLPSGESLLEGVEFSLPDSSLMAVIGAGGADTSTLLKTLTGTRQPTAGQVLVDGRDLHDNHGELGRRIGLVPRDDLVHSQLTVSQALTYASELRFPADLDPAARTARIAEVIRELGLDEHAHTRISNLADCRRKLASVALELLTQPSLLLLDEPTSGLDPEHATAVMIVLRELADSGRTVVVMTHRVADLDICDQVMLLAPGGRTAYAGPPAEMREYFGREDYSDIVTDVAHEPDRAAAEFARHTARTKVSGGAAPGPRREAAPPRVPQPRQPAPRRQPKMKQVSTLVRRHGRLLASDRAYGLFQALLPALLAALITTMPGETSLGQPPSLDLTEPSRLLVILIVGAALMGVSSSARALIGERAIYAREKAVGLAPSAYLLAKLIVFALLAAVQSAVLVGLVLAIEPGPSDGNVSAAGWFALWIVVAATAFGSAVIGLLISAVRLARIDRRG